MKTNTHFLSYLAHSFVEREMFQTKAVKKIKTQIVCSVTFLSKIVPFMRQSEKIIVQRCRPQIRIWRMRFACWTHKATDKNTGCVMLTDFSLQELLNERA